MRIRTYKTTNKKTVAHAYGYAKEESIVARIRKHIHRLTEEQLLQLGEWTGNCILLPSQVEMIVFLLGNPSEPDMLYMEKIVES